MDDQVAWALELKVKNPGQIDSFRKLMDEMVVSTHAELGTLAYEWDFSDDNTRVTLYERYADSDAALAHLETFDQKFAQPFWSAVTWAGQTVLGTPSDALK